MAKRNDPLADIASKIGKAQLHASEDKDSNKSPHNIASRKIETSQTLTSKKEESKPNNISSLNSIKPIQSKKNDAKVRATFYFDEETLNLFYKTAKTYKYKKSEFMNTIVKSACNDLLEKLK